MSSLSKFEKLGTILSKNQLKQIMGGYSCGYKNYRTGQVMCNLSQAEAQHMASAWSSGAYWCCASCASNGGGASYC
jgi:hypothetical protein